MMHDAPSWEALIEYDETGEVLWCGEPPEQSASWQIDPALCAWREAQARAQLAYGHWRRVAGADAYAVYRAAQDQADSAQRLLEVSRVLGIG
ncbi:MAG TPA: hypothetical protein VH276_01890 [Solirubrobacteraceae bacterium]|jgi:hypothetical protein|nr:hypothetical protein [Solirubrobacteraceae bacterium]